LAPILADDLAPPNPSICHPQALVTADNDIRLNDDVRPSGKTAAVPSPVMDKLQAAARQLIAQVEPGTADGVTCKDLFPDIYRISVPKHRALFVADIYVGRGVSFFYLILSDPATGAVTRDPPRIGAKWPQSFGAKDPLVKKPFVSSADLFQNHHPQIVFEERVHNGTAYNAVIYHYFDVGPNLALTQVLARETRVWDDTRNETLDRKLTQLSSTRLRLDTFAVSSDDSAQRKELGYVILESLGTGAPFRVTQRHPKDRHLKTGLVSYMSGSPDEDDDFLREGYTDYY
jgi:hypothetical protein